MMYMSILTHLIFIIYKMNSSGEIFTQSKQIRKRPKGKPKRKNHIDYLNQQHEDSDNIQPDKMCNSISTKKIKNP